MLSKLLKKDLKKNMKWMWILFVGAIVIAAITRGCAELAKNIIFFKVLTIFFDSIFYAVLANALIQPFLRSFLNFTKSVYGDESYLTHTLPVTKNQIFNSKFLTAVIEMLLAFISVLCAVIIRFASPSFLPTLKMFLSTVIVGNFSTLIVLALMFMLIIVEFLMFISIIYFAIIMGFKAHEKKILKSFLITALMAFISITVLSVFMIIVLLINKVNLSSTTLMLSNTAFTSLILTGIIVYSAIIITFYLLAKKEFNKGVNVD